MQNEPYYAYTKLAWYPHMKPNDVEIWERFIMQNPDKYEQVQYDVCCGDGAEFDTNLGDSPSSSADKLYRKKIDVVGYKGDSIDIIELKPNAGASALGQVLGYVVLYKSEHPSLKEPRPVVITNAIRPDMLKMANAMGVTVLVA